MDYSSISIETLAEIDRACGDRLRHRHADGSPVLPAPEYERYEAANSPVNQRSSTTEATRTSNMGESRRHRTEQLDWQAMKDKMTRLAEQRYNARLQDKHQQLVKQGVLRPCKIA